MHEIQRPGVIFVLILLACSMAAWNVHLYSNSRPNSNGWSQASSQFHLVSNTSLLKIIFISRTG